MNKTQVRNYLRDRLAPFGILVVELSITDFQFSSEFNKAIESKQTAEQHALRAERDLDRIKVEAQQGIATAQADAEALRLQRQVISPDLIKLRQIDAWAARLLQTIKDKYQNMRDGSNAHETK